MLGRPIGSHVVFDELILIAFVTDESLSITLPNNLAYMYRYGIGVDAWRERAVELYRMGIKYADNQRCKNALREMGETY